MSRQLLFICLIIFFLRISTRSQVLYPHLSGPTLAEAVRSDFTPQLVFSYAEARDTLYAKILQKNDSIAAVYTDFRVRLTPGTDPTVDLFDQGINTEHIYPQSKGATEDTAPFLNMYNMMPSRIDVNQDRADFPFGEIEDVSALKWYFEDVQMQNIPPHSIHLYSEWDQNHFEPREAVKGNIARAMFYIYTIYQHQIDPIDDQYFQDQLTDLCSWHFNDVPDEDEFIWNDEIALRQEGKSNPFVLDCTLAERLYCGQNQNCMSASLDRPAVSSDVVISTAGRKIIVRNKNDSHREMSYRLSGIDGRMIMEGTIHLPAKEVRLIQPFISSPGAYLVHLTDGRGLAVTELIILQP